MIEQEPIDASPPLSKRAARRLIQRAFVLAGRDRHLRQHLREARVITLWVLADWKFVWTVEFNRGRIIFERRPAKHPDLTLTWPTAQEFFQQVETGAGFECEGEPGLRRLLESVTRTFGACLRQVLRDPVDENGDPLC